MRCKTKYNLNDLYLINKIAKKESKLSSET